LCPENLSVKTEADSQKQKANKNYFFSHFANIQDKNHFTVQIVEKFLSSKHLRVSKQYTTFVG
jgi:hypothetical protein